MHQAGWLVLLTLIVWSRCEDQIQIPLSSSLTDGGTPYDQWVLTNRGGPGGGAPDARDDDGDDGESTLESPSNSDDGDTDDDDGDDGDGGDTFDDDFDGSASTASVAAVRNQTSELNSSLAALLRTHNLESLKKSYDPSKPLDRQKLIVADLLKTITSNFSGNTETADTANNKVSSIVHPAIISSTTNFYT